jgi:hypothetical protein
MFLEIRVDIIMRTTLNIENILFPLSLIFFEICLICAITLIYFQTKKIFQTNLKTVGMINKVTSKREFDLRIYNFLIVEYTVNNKNYINKIAKTTVNYEKGQEIEVLYLEKNPKISVVKTEDNSFYKLKREYIIALWAFIVTSIVYDILIFTEIILEKKLNLKLIPILILFCSYILARLINFLKNKKK